MRILQMISSAGLYGAERMMVTLSQDLVRQGHECTVGVFNNAHCRNLEVAECARAFDLPLEIIPCGGRLDWKGIAALRRLIRQRSIDVVHAHGYKADVYCYAATCGICTATIATCHNWIDPRLKVSAYGALDRLVLRRFDLVVAVSDAVAEILRRSGVPADKIRLIDNGIEMARFETARPTFRDELGSQHALVGFVGRLSPEKGGSHLLHAAAIVLRQCADTSFVFVGDGPERGNWQRLAEQLGIANRVHFLGQRSDMPELYASFDVLVLPSLTEGLPLTILEALASRRAVVATAVGAVPKVVIHESTGLLVGPGDVSALASAIERLLQNADIRRHLGEQGCQLVSRRYSSQAMAERYLTAYSAALDAKKRHVKPAPSAATPACDKSGRC